jgi:Putative neutral zinc metallopeptidase
MIFVVEGQFMKWMPGGESGDIEDRRDEGGGGGFQFGGAHIGIGGAIVLLILSFIFRTNLFTLLGGGSVDSGTAVSQPDPARDAAEKPLVQFVSYSMTRRIPGRSFYPSRPARLIDTPSWYCFAIRLNPDAVEQSPLRGLFIVRRMKRFTLTFPFSTS